MKTITEKQPWASLIVEGIKDIENRTWPTKYRGRVLIHASAKGWKWKLVFNYLSHAARDVMSALGYDANWLKQLPTSAIIGSVEIVDCVINHSSIWAEKTEGWCGENSKLHQEWFGKPIIYNWVLAHPIQFPEPIPAKGMLGFWDYPNILSEPEEENGPLFCHCKLPVKEVNQVGGFSSFYYCRYCEGKWYK